ncbi:hypothetical protein L218DRAFT_995320 [Marasmius fiardii PR-910]|nr:hypothetical protein L218DRAFT_995320 [Marasmius fiardii PR-910]
MSDNATAQATAKLIEALEHQRLVAYIDVLSAALLVYEIIINLHAEIEYIWMRKWTFVTGLYLLQRYLPIFDTLGFVLHHTFGANLSIIQCSSSHKTAGWFIMVGIVLSEILLTLRVWAVWRRSIPVAIGLVMFYVACWVPSFVLFDRFLSAEKFAPLPLPILRGCFITGGNNFLWVCWVLMMVYDTGIFVMILIPGISAYRRGGRSELIETVHQDGVIYYAFIFLTSLINVIVILTLSHDLVHLLSTFERVFHSSLNSRAILHIRQVAAHLSNYRTISDVRITRHGMNTNDVDLPSLRASERNSQEVNST